MERIFGEAARGAARAGEPALTLHARLQSGSELQTPLNRVNSHVFSSTNKATQSGCFSVRNNVPVRAFIEKPWKKKVHSK